MTTQNIKIDKMQGTITIPIHNGTDRVVLDLSFLRKQAIADFVNEQAVRARKHSGESISEDIALAVGYFDVSLDQIYDEDTTLVSLDDFTLAQIIRYRAERDSKIKEKKG